MIKKQFVIDITDLEDLKVSGNIPVLAAVASESMEILESNGSVILKRSYDNAPDDVYKIYDDPSDFARDWKASFYHIVY